MTAAADAMVRRGLKGAVKTDGKQPLHATCSLRDGAQYYIAASKTDGDSHEQRQLTSIVLHWHVADTWILRIS
jgi:hypothetical protein